MQHGHKSRLPAKRDGASRIVQSEDNNPEQYQEVRLYEICREDGGTIWVQGQQLVGKCQGGAVRCLPVSVGRAPWSALCKQPADWAATAKRSAHIPPELGINQRTGMGSTTLSQLAFPVDRDPGSFRHYSQTEQQSMTATNTNSAECCRVAYAVQSSVL